MYLFINSLNRITSFQLNNACLLNDKFLTPSLFSCKSKKFMVWVRITFGLRPHVIRAETINIFLYCMNKQGVTNGIIYTNIYDGVGMIYLKIVFDNHRFIVAKFDLHVAKHVLPALDCKSPHCVALHISFVLCFLLQCSVSQKKYNTNSGYFCSTFATFPTALLKQHQLYLDIFCK